MAVLNLVRPDQSDVKYKISKFPDGQQDIVLLGLPSKTSFTDTFEIYSRFNSWKDLELIVCAKKALDGFGVKSSLFIPYLLGARSDRKFVTGGNSYLVNVLAPVINSLEFVEVVTYDVHSDVAAACIKNLRNKSNNVLVDYMLTKTKYDNMNVALISPDAGAYKKIFDVAKYFGIPNIITAMKHRDLESGQITSTEIHIPESKKFDAFIIIDDICDGGRTFLELAKVIRTSIRYESDIILCVTHGIFSAGFGELAKHIDRIYCTNSYSDVEIYTTIDGIDELYVKQLKVI